ncbi:MAG TPA: serine hydroxymethyltransferase [Candidatus Bathyarchaeia archaeon]|nr:serine hydroxymethyltransferase [Candidatus Bathyarchaeia archaeon]
MLSSTDSRISSLIAAEIRRQEETINLIASENYVSPAVLEAMGSSLTNKYAEGYPGKRYYAGCEVIDMVEQEAIERFKKLFRAEHVNVQPHAGSQANMAVYMAALKPGDTILGMSLNAGGHLTHGHAVNFSGIIYKSVQYGIHPDTELLDYADIARLADMHRPALIIVGASAYSRIIDFEKMGEIARNVGALLLADIAHIAGLVAAGKHPSPIGHADFVSSTTHKTLRGPRGGLIMSKAAHRTALDRAIMPGMQGGPCLHIIAAKAVAAHLALQPSFAVYQEQIITNAQHMATLFKKRGYRIVAGGTDNHLFVLDLSSKKITGLEAQTILEKAGITVSRSTIPFDTQKPWIASGIRLGTPAITTRGMTTSDVEYIVEYIDDVLQHRTDDIHIRAIAEKVKKYAQLFPLYQEVPHISPTTSQIHTTPNF